MKKDFDRWNAKKKQTNAGAKRPAYHTREIWWCALGTNIGSEQDGTGHNFDRPVVIVRGFNREVCFVVALMGRKRTSPFHFPVGVIEDRQASAILFTSALARYQTTGPKAGNSRHQDIQRFDCETEGNPFSW